MHWPEYIHHITLHFPIAGSILLAPVAAWWVHTDDPRLEQVVRFGGAAIFAVTTVAVISGIVAAPGMLGGDGPQTLSDHRNMGVTVWSAMAAAVIGFEVGRRRAHDYTKRFGALCWIAVAFGVIGAGHWGGSALHSDTIPWQGEPPVVSREAVP